MGLAFGLEELGELEFVFFNQVVVLRDAPIPSVFSRSCEGGCRSNRTRPEVRRENAEQLVAGTWMRRQNRWLNAR